MRAIGFLVFGSVLVVTPLAAQVPVQQLVFPHIAVGGDWETELSLVAGAEETAEGTIYFLSQSGGELMVRVNGGAPTASFDFSIGRNSYATYLLSAEAPTKAGWVFIDQYYAGMYGQGTIQGQVTYRQKSGNRFVSQVGVLSSPSLRDARLFFDNTGGNQSALAVASGARTTIRVELFSLQGESQASTTVDLAEFGQRAIYVEQLFSRSADSKGVLRLTSSEPFFMVSLNSRDTNWSSSASMGAVYERRVLAEFDTSYEWNLRMHQDGELLYGIADLLAPAQADKVWSAASGSLVSTSSGTTILHLNIHLPFSSGVTVNLNLLADHSAAATGEISGKAVGLKDDGTIWKQGTFRMRSVKAQENAAPLLPGRIKARPR